MPDEPEEDQQQPEQAPTEETGDEETTAPPTGQNATPPPFIPGGNQTPAPQVDRTDPTEGQTIPNVDQPSGQSPLVLHEAPKPGFRGVLDRVLDAISGTKDSQIYTDDQGNKYVQHPPLSRGQQWARVADMALSGGAAGWAAGRGAGNGGKALQAGVDAGGQIRQAEKDKDTANQAAVRQNRLDQFNYNKMTQQMIENQFALTRMKQEANEHDSAYEEAQVGQEEKLNSIPLGTYNGVDNLPDLKKEHPEVIKDFYNTKDIVAIPHVNPETGLHDGASFFLRRPGVTDAVLPPGAPFHVAAMNDDGDYGLQVHHSTGPMKQSEIDQLNLAAHTTMGSQTKEKLEEKQKTDAAAASAAEAALHKSQLPVAASEVAKNLAEAGKAKSESVPAGQTPEVEADIAEGLASGRYLMGKDIPLRTSKDQVSAAAHTKAADDFSRSHYGLPYSPEIIRQESKLAEQPKTQAFLSGIDRMIGSPGMPGQLDQVLDLAKRSGLGPNAPANEVSLWVRQHLGNEDAKNFETALSDTQTALGTLIGNPLLGSGESDLKLKTAQGQFGSNPTIDNLRGAVATTKAILQNSRAALAKNNRYIQQRYGDAYSPTAATAQPGQQAAPAKGGLVGPIRQGEPVATGPGGHQVVLRGNQWVDPLTGTPPQPVAAGATQQ